MKSPRHALARAALAAAACAAASGTFAQVSYVATQPGAGLRHLNQRGDVIANVGTNITRYDAGGGSTPYLPGFGITTLMGLTDSGGFFMTGHDPFSDEAVVRQYGPTFYVPVGTHNYGKSLSINGSMSRDGRYGVIWSSPFTTSWKIAPGTGSTYSPLTLRAVNSAGLFAGADTSGRPALYNGDISTVLSTSPGIVTALNDRGQSAGTVGTNAFIANGTVLSLLGRLQATGTHDVSSMNELGMVVGNHRAGSVETAVLWTSDGTAIDLNTRVTAGAFERLARTTSVNDAGQVIATSASGAQTYLLTPTGTLNWIGGDASFGARLSWDSSGLALGPNRLLDARIAPTGDVTATLDTGAIIRALTVGSAGGANRATLRLAQGAVLDNRAAVVIETTGVLEGRGVIAGALANRGLIAGSAAAPLALAIGGNFDNFGQISGSGRIEATLINRGGGAGVRLAGSDSMQFVGASHTNADAGTIELRGGATAEFFGALTNQGGAFIRLDDATLRARNGLVNGGQVQIAFGGASFFGSVVNQAATAPNRGRIIASGGAEVTFWDSVTNLGEIRASAGSRLVYFGPVNGSGSFSTNGGGYHRFEGGFSPTASATALLEQGDGGEGQRFGDVEFASTLSLSRAGAADAPLAFDGRVFFDTGAALSLAYTGSEALVLGTRWQLFSFNAGLPAGGFERLTLPALAADLMWDTGDLLVGGQIAITAVPEPSSWMLLLAGAAVVCRLARQRRGMGREG